jgi:hypothetical protein
VFIDLILMVNNVLSEGRSKMGKKKSKAENFGIGTSTTTTISSSSCRSSEIPATPKGSSTTTSTSSTSAAKEVTVSDKAIVDACNQGNLSQLRQWAKLGIRVKSGQALYCIKQLDLEI